MLAPAAVAALAPARAADEPFRALGEAWLGLVDRGRYDDSWQATSGHFRASVTPQRWAEAARAAREPLGGVIARELQSITHATALPGAPDGDYQVLRFHSRFDHKASAIETLTLVREAGGWSIAGYFIK